MRKKVAGKLLSVVLAAGMVAGMLGGCGQAGGNSADGTQESVQPSSEAAAGGTEAAAEKEPITFQIAASKHALSQCDDFNDKVVFQMAEEATGVHIDWITIEDGASEKVNALLTADLPDAFLGTVNENQIAASMDSFMDVSGLLDTYAPHVVADYSKMQENGIDLLTWPDGSIRSLMTGLEVNYENDGEAIMYINTEWLDKVGMEVPTTVDELYEVLCAFRDNDMNGNGDPDDEIPMEMTTANWAAQFNNLLNPWGIAAELGSSDIDYGKMVKNGEVVSTFDTDEYRAYLDYMHKLYADGLLDEEGFAQTNDQFYAKLQSGVVGCYYGWMPYSNFDEDEAAKWVPVRVLQAEEDIVPVKSGKRDRLFANRTGFVITTACEAPERLLEWWDYLSSSTEIKYTMRFGEKGGYWDIDENGQVYQKTPEGLTADFTVENYKQTYGMNDVCTLILKDESIAVSEEEAFSTWIRSRYVDEIWDQLPTEYLPTRFVDPAKVDERTFIETELSTYISNFNATSIVEGIDDAGWQLHLEQLEALGYYDWVQWYRDFYEGNF